MQDLRRFVPVHTVPASPETAEAPPPSASSSRVAALRPSALPDTWSSRDVSYVLLQIHWNGGDVPHVLGSGGGALPRL